MQKKWVEGQESIDRCQDVIGYGRWVHRLCWVIEIFLIDYILIQTMPSIDDLYMYLLIKLNDWKNDVYIDAAAEVAISRKSSEKKYWKKTAESIP